LCRIVVLIQHGDATLKYIHSTCETRLLKAKHVLLKQ